MPADPGGRWQRRGRLLWTGLVVGRAEQEALAVELRPGVLRPDWSAVHLVAAREVLKRHLEARPQGLRRWADLTALEDETWRAILRLFLAHGRAPIVDEVTRATGCSLEATQGAIQSLGARDLVVLDQAGGAVLAAYPFTGYPTGHRVMIGGHTVASLCAIDALGAGTMCGGDSVIISACAHCSQPIQIETCGGGAQLGTVTPAAAVVWYTIRFDGCAARSSCPSTLFLCGDNHLQQWRATRPSSEGGDRLTIPEAFEIGGALFGPLLRSAA